MPVLSTTRCIALAVLSSVMLCLGCASYATPGGPADLRTFGMKTMQTDGTVGQALDKQPLATLPASVAVVRVQASGYRSETSQGWGGGNYSVVTTRDIEDPKEFDRLAHLPLVRGLAALNRLLLSEHLESDVELRRAAAALHADMLLVYTLDTTFDVQDKLAPLSVITLGLSPNIQAKVVCTASAVLMDTRNGYIYGIAEATDRQSQLADGWTSEAALDAARRRTESAAFDKLIGELAATWQGVVQTLSGPQHKTAAE